VLIYALVNIGAFARVAAPWLEPTLQMHSNHLASVFWSGAFACFVIIYGPRLVSATPSRGS
ncbi:MAG: NnrS family protein, partial [Alphaproteobacteria bacterium]|nr:NnrS family protein [Alphaproteobacteria bacterium]